MKRLTSFQKKVYTVVKQIPCGERRSYAWVARKTGRPRAVRSIGNILKRNPFVIAVPCHRVVRSDGSLGGYILGADLKKKLLKTERRLNLRTEV